MVDPDTLRRRIEALLGYIGRMQRFSSMDRGTFVADPDTYNLAERYLHLAVEAALDIANHIIADQGYESPETYRDAFAILSAHGVVASELAQHLQAWAGFRNILVHAYLDIDHGMAWDAIANDLDDLRSWAAIGARWL